MTDEAEADSASSWRELAVARSLDPARARAEKRVQRFLDAALALMSGPRGKDFTVQEVVEKSGQSLRSFYLYFAGKNELLLTLFEESVRATAGRLEVAIADETVPLDRLHRFVVEYHALCQTSPPGRGKKVGAAPAMVEFAQQLLTERPKEASSAFVPLVDLLTGLLDEAAAAGGLRAGLDHRHIAGVVLQSIGFSIFASTISGTSVRSGDGGAEELWDLIFRGLSAAQT
jgi:AcrR family transcriptional regulator